MGKKHAPWANGLMGLFRRFEKILLIQMEVFTIWSANLGLTWAFLIMGLILKKVFLLKAIWLWLDLALLCRARPCRICNSHRYACNTTSWEAWLVFQKVSSTGFTKFWTLWLNSQRIFSYHFWTMKPGQLRFCTARFFHQYQGSRATISVWVPYKPVSNVWSHRRFINMGIILYKNAYITAISTKKSVFLTISRLKLWPRICVWALEVLETLLLSVADERPNGTQEASRGEPSHAWS